MSVKPTAKAKEIIEEINILRSNPPLYAKKVEEYSKYFTDKAIKLPNFNIKIMTQEGAAPYLETIEYLRGKEKVNELIPSKALCEIAKEVFDNMKNSETGEIDEELYSNTIDKYGSFNGKFTRAVDLGGFTSEQIVINFLVCDGDPERSQREPILGTGLNKIGVAFGRDNANSTICILLTCTEFNNIKDPDDVMIFKDSEEEEKEKLEKEKAEKERLEKEKIEKEKIEKEKAEKEKAEKEKLEKEKIEKEKKEEENLAKEKERIEKERLEKEKLEKEKLEKEKAEKEKKEKEKKEEEKKKKELTKKKYEVNNNENKGEPINIFKLKKKNQITHAVPKDKLPEGVASMTFSDTIVIEGGKRYKIITYNKVMLDGTKKTEEVKQCLD